MKNTTFYIILGALFLMSSPATADMKGQAGAEHEDFWQDHEEEESHGHGGLHGGQFGDASDMYHYEVLLDEQGDVRVYMYDGEAEPIADITDLKARWTLNPDAEYPLTGDLALSADKQYFLLDLPAVTAPHVAVKIEAQKDGQWWPVEFLLSEEDHD